MGASCVLAKEGAAEQALRPHHAQDCVSPYRNPAAMQPSTLPMPPSTVTTKAAPRNVMPIEGDTGKIMLANDPVAPARAAPTPAVSA
jgi:hypothetical protein